MTSPSPTPSLDALLSHSAWVRSLARSLVSDSATADDIEQQAWVTALENPPSHSGNLRAWWTSVVRSAAGSKWREQKRRREVDGDHAFMGESTQDLSPRELAERHETFRRLASSVANLPEPYGSTIYLRYFEGMSVREVANKQCVPVDTAQTHINRGL